MNEPIVVTRRTVHLYPEVVLGLAAVKVMLFPVGFGTLRLSAYERGGFRMLNGSAFRVS